MHSGLSQRLAAGDTHLTGGMLPDLPENIVEATRCALVERVLGVAPAAAQGASGEAHEHGRQAHSA